MFDNYIICIIVSIDVCMQFVVTRQTDSCVHAVCCYKTDSCVHAVCCYKTDRQLCACGLLLQDRQTDSCPKRMLKVAPYKSADTAEGCKYAAADGSFCVVGVRMFHVFQDVRRIFRIMFQLLITIVSSPIVKQCKMCD
jgi:hypothetical protein